MKRREFVATLGATAMLPLAVLAQETSRPKRIGILMPFPRTDTEMQGRVRLFRDELRKRGWAAGINAQFDERWTGANMDLIRSTATNMLELGPDVILANGARVIPILMELTRTLPVVNAGGSDPVGLGYAESLSHPGRNVTGFAHFEPSIVGKMVQALKEIAPNISHIVMIYHSDNLAGAVLARSFKSTTAQLGITSTLAQVHSLAEIESALSATAAQPNGAAFFPVDVALNALAEPIIATVARMRLPAVYGERNFVKSGGLLYYGTDQLEIYRGAASYVDRILRGEKAGDLPYQQPTKYELIVNLGTAKSMGLIVPPRLIFTADEVIE